MQFAVPSTPARNVLTVDTFLGVDFSNESASVDQRRSPYAENVIRDVPGKVRKRMGWHLISQYSGRINGVHRRKGDSSLLIHAGTKYYNGSTEVWSGAADTRSCGYQMGGKLYLLDGLELLVWDGTAMKRARDGAYTPLLTIGKTPSGGGTQYEGLNLLSPQFKEQFAGTAGAVLYQLSFSGLDSVDNVEVLNSSGTWATKASGTDYSVSLSAGTVTFVSAPGVSPVTGEDNVRITASRTVSGYADRIGKCRFGQLFGVNGAADRLFVSGNPDYGNYDWYSGQDDPTYFSDMAYSVLGSSSAAIVGYMLINNYLAVAKDSREEERNIIIRQGTMVTEDKTSVPAFPIVNSLQGCGAVSPYSFAYLYNEPVFLTGQGVYAVTTSDIAGERYSQLRSFFLNGRLLSETGLEEAVACVHNAMYWLCVNGKAYILDALQSVSTDKSAPYSTRQYAGFYETNIPARVILSDGDTLYFGTEDGKLCSFYTEKESLLSYSDNGSPIACCWTTPDFSGKLFYRNKTFRYLAVKLSSMSSASVKLYLRNKGIWQFIKEDTSTARYFSFSNITFSKWTFSNDLTSKTLHTKTRLKKVDKTAYKFENSVLNEPFGLMEYAIEYAESGHYKG